MELLIILIIGGFFLWLMVLGVGGMLAVFDTDKQRKKALATADQTYAAKFNGDSPVIWEIGLRSGLRAKEIIQAGAERGYRVDSSVNPDKWTTVLTFVKG